MKLTVTGKQIEISTTVRASIVKKIEKLERVLNSNAVSAQCVIARERQRFVCDLTVHVRGDHILHAMTRHQNVTSATGIAVDKIAQQAHKVVDRWKDKRRMKPVEAPFDVAPSTTQPPRIVRARRFQLRPLTVDDAVIALETGTESFLVFREVETGAIAVIYKRPDGRFGLIEPEA